MKLLTKDPCPSIAALLLGNYELLFRGWNSLLFFPWGLGLVIVLISLWVDRYGPKWSGWLRFRPRSATLGPVVREPTAVWQADQIVPAGRTGLPSPSHRSRHYRHLAGALDVRGHKLAELGRVFL